MRAWAVTWRRLWPAVLLVVGVVSLLPFARVRAVRQGIEEALLSPAGWWRARMAPPLAHAASAEAEPDPEVFLAIQNAGADLLPPDRSWAAGGVFEVLPLGDRRSTGELRFAVANRVPVEQPVLRGDVRLPGAGDLPSVALVGFTCSGAGGDTVLRPVTAKGSSLPACAGDPRGRGRRILFTASGDGRDTLRVVAPESRGNLRDGDPVYVDLALATASWGTDWTPPAGAELLLGTIRIDPDEPRWEDAARVAPFFDVELLESVAVRFPEAITRVRTQEPAGVLARVVERTVERRSERTVDVAVPESFVVDVGRESGVFRGAVVAAEDRVLGRVVHAGFTASRVEPFWCDGFELRVLLLGGGSARSCVVRTVRGPDGTIGVEGVPAQWQHVRTAVVTSLSSRDAPPGLKVGVLVRDTEGGWTLETPREVPAEVTVFLRDPGSGS